ncbi:transcriptional regulator, TetR family [Maridesulfovibrio ferrireducens]|uniref:Transcriptional regulator, TetR family n=1 Tax=Maridesulfovibrio ferrireducens TaxID=246191 RepID=A0A1G9GWX2_9BACT|nr:TetR family transcriptional regulator [Maridesulfovibrio ferrireducens]SDL05166.1 transcriptional regulator, TetR family [Maridesulfovibrio ferrireducens]
MARKTKEEAEKTRQALLSSAFKVFSTKGYAKTTLQDIAEDSGVTRGAVYWHFKNKTDLFEKLLDHAFLPVQSIIFSKFDDKSSPEEILVTLMKIWLNHATSDKNFRTAFEIIFNKTEWSDELMPFKLKYKNEEFKFIKQVELIFERGINEGVFRKDLKPAVASAFYYSSLFGLAQYSLFFEEELDINKEIDMFINMFLHSCLCKK